MVEPARTIVVNGILVLWDRSLREDLRRHRRRHPPDPRLRRDVAEPSKRRADVIIPEGGLIRPALEVLLALSGKPHSTTNERPGSALTHSA